jgi:hydroxymethylpyrimidine/phosphomethylpyrimidine kinase
VRLLAIAGSDSSGRAGLQVDLATFAAHGAEAATVVTAVTAQGGGGVLAIEVISAATVAAQLDAALDEGVDGVKVGMLGDARVVEVVARRLAALRGAPIVVDPVLAASSGMALLEDAAIEPLRRLLLPAATVITPNLPELARLTGCAVESDGDRVAAARSLAAGGPAVLVKGGHAEGALLVDLLVHTGGVARFEHPRQARSARGTGCALASALTARLARGEALVDAVRGAIDHVQQRIAAAAPR